MNALIEQILTSKEVEGPGGKKVGESRCGHLPARQAAPEGCREKDRGRKQEIGEMVLVGIDGNDEHQAEERTGHACGGEAVPSAP